MTTLADLIEETKTHLFGDLTEEANRLDGPITDTDTSITFKYPIGGIAAGVVLAIDLEEIRVWAAAGLSAPTVERGVNGTVAAAHADLAYVAVKPKFSNFRILRQINNDLLDLSAPENGLYRMRTVEVTFNANLAAYDLPGVENAEAVYDVESKFTGMTNNWNPAKYWRLEREMNTTDFPSGLALTINGSGQPGQLVRVIYKDHFTPLVNLSDDVAVTGLSSTAFDLPPMGAALRLVAPTEIGRNFTDNQGDSRRSDEVPAGAKGRSPLTLSALRDRRIRAEAGRLARRYPNKRRL